MSTSSETRVGFRHRLRDHIESPLVTTLILSVIVLNAVTLGLATSATVTSGFGRALEIADEIIITIFVVELAIKIYAYGPRFFTKWWNIFDLVVVSFSLLPASENLSVLRALRIIRATRLLSVVPQMREVVLALLNALPGMGSVMCVLSLVYYIVAVMTTRLFGEMFPEWFGSLGASLYSLFQIMTLESWSMGIVRPVMEVYPYAWTLFVPFIIMTAFAVLNLFIGLLVNSLQGVYEEEQKDEMDQHRRLMREENKALSDQMDEIGRQLAELRQALDRPPKENRGTADDS